jgi:hypothetical protein
MIEIQLVDAGFEKAFNAFAAGSKKDTQTLLRDQARLFVKDALRITPPNKGGKWNQQGGNLAIKNDMAKLFVQVRKGGVMESGEMLELMRKVKNRRGRVRGRKVKKPVQAGQYRAAMAALQKRVGKLASGWNQAAVRLGVIPPAWILRHGFGRGGIEIQFARADLRILIYNQVAYVGNVQGFERVIASALAKRTRAMSRQTERFLETGARKAGFK